MGFRLYREILEYAPGDWTSGERLVALVIADDAKDETRRSWIPNELLCKRTGMTAVGVRKALHKLASRGYEMRVSHGQDNRGRDVYALRGHSVDYLVPPATALYGDPVGSPFPVDNSLNGDPVGSPYGGPDEPNGDPVGSHGDPPVSPLSPYGDPVGSPLPSVNLTLNIPSTEEADLDSPPVEGAREPPGQDRLHLNGWAGPIERAAAAAIRWEH